MADRVEEPLWRRLGAHVLAEGGTHFAVWAPNAQQVSVVGDFNGWDGNADPMARDGDVWETTVPSAGSGATYQFLVQCSDGVWRHKADPMAFHAQVPPERASRVHASTHEWHDADWLTERAGRTAVYEPMSTYELHLGSWKRNPDGTPWTYDEMAAELPAYLSDLGFTHVELMPVMQHPYGGSWGYHVTGYFAPDSRYGDPDGLRRLIDAFHAHDVAVILDWVPGHFATDEWALARFDGTALYEHPDPQRGWHPEWGSFIFDLGRREVADFLIGNALYWLQEFHADGLRVDGVASMLYLDYSRGPGQWTPNEHGGNENLEAVRFFQELNARLYAEVPGIVMVAEESTAWPGVTQPTSAGGLGFGFKWNMGWMHDSLSYLQRDPIHRSHHHGEMTFTLVYAHAENYVLPLSHDEVVHGKGSLLTKMPGDREQQLATLRAYLAYQWAHPGKQLVFMGGEIAQEREWAEARELDWWILREPGHAGVQAMVRDLNRAYRDHPALWQRDNETDGFAWIDADAAGHNVFAFRRLGRDEDEIVCVTNFAGIEHDRFRLALPRPGRWLEVLNTDATPYAGGGRGNLGEVTAHPAPPAQADAPGGLPAYADVVLPPLSTLWLRPA
ncbi:MAG: 1,4-alpha-glucan branching protein GlgB [Nocardioidaceae bacterium]|nr:1,4-alpha-glucan branching protein GlgB [Nocardioidaceae bacterium]